MAAKHAKIIFFLIFLAAFFGAAAYFTFFKKPDLFEVKSGDITEDIKAQGSIIAANDIKLGFNDSGRVEFVNVKPGSAVEEGELIASLDSNELSAELKKYEAQVELAKAKLSQLLAGTRSEELKLLEAQVGSARVEFDNALKNFENVKIKADNDMTKAYQDAVNISDSILLTASNSMDSLNSIYQPSNKLETFFFVSDEKKKSDAEWQIIFTREAFESLKDDVKKIKADPSNKNIDEILPKFKVSMEIIRLSLSKTYDALSSATVVSGQKNIDDFKSDIARVRAGINSTQTDLLNKEQAINTQKISSQNIISEAENVVKAKKAALSEKEEELALKEAKPRDVEVAVYQAQIKEAESNRVLLKEKIRNFDIFAPTSGVVKNVFTRKGSFINAGTAAISMVLASDFQIESELSLEDAKKVRVGDKAEIKFNISGENKTAKGSVINVVLEGERPKVYIAISGAVFGLEPAMAADLSITATLKRGILLIPRSSIMQNGDEKSVLLFSGGKKQKTKITTGMESKDDIEVLSGLYEGDIIVSR